METHFNTLSFWTCARVIESENNLSKLVWAKKGKSLPTSLVLHIRPMQWSEVFYQWLVNINMLQLKCFWGNFGKTCLALPDSCQAHKMKKLYVMWQKLSPPITKMFQGKYCILKENIRLEEVTYRAGSLTSFLGHLGATCLLKISLPLACWEKVSGDLWVAVPPPLDNNFLSQLLTLDHFLSASFANPALSLTYHWHSPFQYLSLFDVWAFAFRSHDKSRCCFISYKSIVCFGFVFVCVADGTWWWGWWSAVGRRAAHLVAPPKPSLLLPPPAT